jgi:hypothetical protein
MLTTGIFKVIHVMQRIEWTKSYLCRCPSFVDRFEINHNIAKRNA